MVRPISLSLSCHLWLHPIRVGDIGVNWNPAISLSVVEDVLASMLFDSMKNPRIFLIPRLSLSEIISDIGVDEEICDTFEVTLSLPRTTESTTTPSRIPSWKIKSDLKLSSNLSPLWNVVSGVRLKE